MAKLAVNALIRLWSKDSSTACARPITRWTAGVLSHASRSLPSRNAQRYASGCGREAKPFVFRKLLEETDFGDPTHTELEHREGRAEEGRVGQGRRKRCTAGHGRTGGSRRKRRLEHRADDGQSFTPAELLRSASATPSPTPRARG